MQKISGSEHQLDAYLGQSCIATLSFEPEQGLRFFYHDKWQQEGYALSPHLPLDNSAAASQLAIKAFFQNLFPEGENLEILSQNFQISRHNVFAITQALGLDLPGALQIISSGNKLPITASFRVIHDSEISERLKYYQPRNLVIWDGKPRLSVAGVHQKINVVVNEKGEIGFGEGQLCSTHILKFERSSKQHIILNEFLMMTLAKKIGLNAADVELRYFNHYPTLLVKRFDRTLKGNKTQRRHMIDGCQALNLLPEYKYERHLGSGRDVKHIREGANLPALFAFCDTCDNAAKAKKQLLQWVLFNTIIGNFDAHGKNISFFVSQSGISVAPFYDLLCISVYPEFDQEFAMALGDEFDAHVSAYQLIEFANNCGIPKTIVANTLENLCKKISLALPELTSFSRNDEEKLFVNMLLGSVDDRVRHFQNIAAIF